jgi:hypothetical protein
MGGRVGWSARRSGCVRCAALVAFLEVGFGCATNPSEPISPPTADVAVLFVGNSLTYTNDLPGHLRVLLGEHGDVGTVEVASVAYPNFGLEDHWNQMAARTLIAAGGWDYVVVQQGPSATEGRPSLIEFSRRFSAEVQAAGGRLAVYMVWPSAARSFDFDGVSEAHRTAAGEAGALLFPVGEAWRAAWTRDADLPLYGADGFHPGRLGTYLAALVMYEQITGRPASALPDGLVGPGGTEALPEGVTRILHEAASEANAAFALPR